MKPKQLLWAILILTLGGVVAAFILNQRVKPSLSFYGAAAEFTLTDRSGQSLSLKDLKGKIWIADFIFTHCAGQCPMMSRQMSRLQKQLPSSITLVSFTVDPARDTPQALAEYARNYGADSNRWFFLTGSKETLNQITASFYMNPADDPNLHSVRLALVDRRARIRGYYDGADDQAIQKLFADVAALLRESR